MMQKKYSAGAHMINMGKHNSYEEVPDYASFGRKLKLMRPLSPLQQLPLVLVLNTFWPFSLQ